MLYKESNVEEKFMLIINSHCVSSKTKKKKKKKKSKIKYRF